MSDSPVERSFEWLRNEVGSLEAAPDRNSRTILWADAAWSLAVARDHRGRLELFVVGDELVPTVTIVRDALEYQQWTTSAGVPLAANRFVFPNAPHFDGVAAFVCSELIENGLYSDLPAAFRRTEPALALALRRASLGNEVLLGLAGELVALQALLRAAAPGSAVPILEAWAGSAPSSRDFQLGPVGVEVKTTTGPTSQHHINGVHQIELGFPVGGVQETSIFLLSLGLRWLEEDANGGTSVPQLVESIVARVVDDQIRDDFLARVRQYGGDASLGYDHSEHCHLPRFKRPFEVRFERLYDMADDAIRVLRSSNIEGLDHVRQDSVTFQVTLPRHVRGDRNPTTGMPRIAEKVLALSKTPLRGPRKALP
ncbi:hypothetical protein ASD16_09855 [Cellulomonas sp. Root485]|nr:hypothetical protein ASD16_09855 [Cellulomonas sp. Root485]